LRRPRVLFYVQHLLGIGHVKRASLLVKAWVEAGLDVNVVSGGEALAQFGFAGAKLIQLPAVKAANRGFTGLVDTQGRELTEDFKQRRRQLLLAAFEACQPDFLIIENYPFGRRQLRWELKPLLQLAHQCRPKPLALCSIRDILQVRSSAREEESLDLVEHYFDGILVHGDYSFIPLEDSVAGIARVADKLFYTGYVTEQNQLSASSVNADIVTADLVGRNEVIVSAGGGAVGYQLMATALTVKPRSSLSHLTWRFLMGPNLSGDEHQQLLSLATEGCILEPLRSDFSQLLANCHLSISQAGYNTVMDILLAQCPAVLVPFEGKAETEQITRSRRLAALGRCSMVPETALTELNLLLAIDRTRAGATALSTPIDLMGGPNSATYLRSLWQQSQK
jgi:predicted glycosyltransferase